MPSVKKSDGQPKHQVAMVFDLNKCLGCQTCGDVLQKVHDTLKHFNESQPEHRLDDIEADFENWAKDLDQFKMHG